LPLQQEVEQFKQIQWISQNMDYFRMYPAPHLAHPGKFQILNQKAPPSNLEIQKKLNIPPEEEEVKSSSTKSIDDESHSSVTSESDYSDVIEEQHNQEMLSFRQSSLFRTRKLLNFEPRTYLGILPERISFLTLLANKLSCDQDMFITAQDAVCLIFRKIR
jgi:hypothetical protein